MLKTIHLNYLNDKAALSERRRRHEPYLYLAVPPVPQPPANLTAPTQEQSNGK